MDEENKYLIEVGEVGPRLNVEAKLLLKITTKADLFVGEVEEERKRRRESREKKR